MKKTFIAVLVIVAAVACVTENYYTFYGQMPDAEDAGETEVLTGDGLGEVGIDVPCQPMCDDRECGFDGCGGECGTCDDENPCTNDSCDSKTGKCQYLPVADGPVVGCGDDDLCNGEETCVEGNCTEGTPVDCDDLNPCTEDSCDSVDGECDNDPVADGPMAACDNGDPCDGPGACESGECAQGTPIDCDDGNPCTTDSCDSENGECDHVAVEDGPEEACDDGNPCTKGTCTAGECTYPFFPLNELQEEIAQGQCLCEEDADCNDLNDDNLCNGVLYCATAEVGEPPEEVSVCQVDEATIKEGTYDDTLWCNGLESCDPATGDKVDGVPPELGDGVDCTVDTCDEENDVVVHTPDDGLCGDEDVCTGMETCDALLDCQDGTPLVCDDGDVCNGEETCDPVAGCQDGTPLTCDDGNACNGAETCDGEVGCQDGTPLVCDDNDACTGVETCDPATGCQDGIPLACDDEDVCNGLETCDAVAGCQYGTPLVCDDGNVCTADSCDPVLGCQYDAALVNGEPCDDGDDCTVGDSCLAGQCQAGADVAPACADFDHDGLQGETDSCPYAFDPAELDLDGDGKADACQPLVGDFAYERPLALTQAGAASTWRRTHEPVEIPLANGIIDDSVVGYWKLDGGQAIDYSGNGNHGTVSGAVAGEGAFGEEAGALVFDGAGNYVNLETPIPTGGGSFTTSTWIRSNSQSNPNQTEFFFGISSTGAPEYRCSFRLGGEIKCEIRGTAYKDSVVSLTTAQDFYDAQWHQLTVVWLAAEDQLQMFIDGHLMASGNWNVEASFQSQYSIWLGCTSYNGGYNEDLCSHTRIDDFLLFNRALSPDEIETYYRSSAPYGTNFVPGAQADFDDVRITETTGAGDPVDTGTTAKRSRILGPRPHSDTPCPMQQDDGSWADREDLCGVVGYWRLDGNADDVTGQHDGVNNGATPTRGRFGDGGGAMEFDGVDDYVDTGMVVQLQQPDSLTLEAWVLLRPGDSVMKLFGFQTTGKEELWVQVVGNGENQQVGFSLRDDDWNKTQAYVDGLSVADGHWHHCAIVRRVAQDELCLYLDGLELSCITDNSLVAFNATSSKTFFIAGQNKAGGLYPMKGAIDEVIIHNVAKSADYIYHRANPGVPKVRFLANTVVENQGTEQAPAYPLRGYALHWGDAAATAALPFVSSLTDAPAVVPDTCYGLLSGCHGYAGWWRFNEGSGTVAVDSSGWKRNGELEGGGTFGPAYGEAGHTFDGLDDMVKVDGFPAWIVGTTIAAEATVTRQTTNQWDCIVSNDRETDGCPQFNLSFTGQTPTVEADHLSLYFADTGCVTGSSYVAASECAVAGEQCHVATRHQFGSAGETAFWEDWDEQSGNWVQGSTPIAAPVESTALSIGGRIGVPEHSFQGIIDDVRISNRALEPDEFLHFPLAACQLGEGGPGAADSDGDGILDDGDFSGVAGDNPCAGGQLVGCDDNAQNDANPDQADDDGDGVGEVIDNCPAVGNSDQADADGDGIGDACEGPQPDFDHDGVPTDVDSCPYAFDPAELDLDGDGQADACEPLTGNLAYQRPLVLSQGGDDSTWRRTHEPVEIPLANGIIDDSLVGYWKLDGGQAIDYSGNGYHGTATGMVGVVGAFGDESGAGGFNGNAKVVAEGTESLLIGTDKVTGMAWVKLDAENGSGGAVLTKPIWNGGGETRQSFGLQVLNGGLPRACLSLGDFTGGGCFEFEHSLSADGWSHLAFTYDGTHVRLYLDGKLDVDFQATGAMYDGMTQLPINIGYKNQPSSSDTFFYGAIDDVLLFNRALTPDEIETYYRSTAPYGTQYAPGAQADFDDVRITETTGAGDPVDTGTTAKRSRILGPRPHSNTPCPMAQDDGTWADREDLCGVVGYWRLDGNADDVTGQHDGVNNGATSTRGRFGDGGGALAFDGGSGVATDSGVVAYGALTIEAWVRMEATGGVGNKAVVGRNGLVQDCSFELSVSPGGFLGATLCNGASYKYGHLNHELPLSRWVHVAVVWTDGVATLYQDGLPGKSFGFAGPIYDSSIPLEIGKSFSHESSGVTGAIDEVIIHNVAKSADYIYHRANPGVPKVRFLANTVVENQGTEQAPAYPLRGYALHWGDAAATAALPFVSSLTDAPAVVPDTCYGLLSGCHGYAGWWRFNEGRGEVVVDQSASRRNGVLFGDAEWTTGPDGIALRFKGVDGYVVVPHEEGLSLAHMTVETLIGPTTGVERYYVSKGRDGDPNNYNYQMVVNGSEQVAFFYEYDNGTNAEVHHDTTVDSEGWTTAGASYDGAGLRLYVNNDAPALLEEAHLPGTSDADLVFGALTHFDDSIVDHLNGAMDSVRISNRALAADEMLHYPLADWEYACLPDCSDKECGDDGCGGSCGACSEGLSCIADTCTVSEGLVGWWSFQEGAGDVVGDVTGNGHDGQATDGTWVPGIDGTAMEFNGTSTRVDTGTSLQMEGQAAMSLAVRFRTLGDINSQQLVVTKSLANYGSGYWMDVFEQTIRVRLYADSADTIAAPCQPNTWYHAVLTYGEGTLRLFVNGEEMGSVELGGTVKDVPSGSVVEPPLQFGCIHLGSMELDRFFEGIIDDVRIFERELSPNEVTLLYEETL